MQFDKFGNLYPDALIKTDLQTFEEYFVDAYPSSVTRKELFLNFLGYRKQLYEIVGNHFFQWIDGSFVSKKLNPNDIDFVTFIDWKLIETHLIEIDKIRSLRYEKNLGLDGYFISVYPDKHEKQLVYQADRIQWLHTFGRSRTNQTKGIIQLSGEHGRA